MNSLDSIGTVPRSITPGTSTVRLSMAQHRLERANTLTELAAIKDKAKASGLTPTDLLKLKTIYEDNKQRLLRKRDAP